MFKNRCLIFILALAALASCTHTKDDGLQIEEAQEPATPVEVAEPSNLLIKYPDVLNERDDHDDDDSVKDDSPPPPYQINVGDTLEISILDEPEMTREVDVIPDGTITYLLVGSIQAKGKTIQELKDDLTRVLDEYFVSPYVSVLSRRIQIPSDEEKRVSILGALKSPGNYAWNKGDRVLDIIAAAGGLLYTQTEFGSRTTANLKASYLSRNGKIVDVDFYRLLQLGDMLHNIRLQPGDFLYIANAEDSNITIMGEVSAPKIIPYTRDISLVEALAMSGGFSTNAYMSRVVILRPSEEDTKYIEVNVNDLLYGRDIRNIILEGGDIIFVPEQGISEYARYAKYITDMLDVILKVYQIREAVLFPKLNRND
ncbi:MAG: polysaccharide biosynthesis/export family protein [Victivallales bacterium]|nr:polysaccharide biosynthesis/export family protein [Victivallales bacterium]